MPIKEKFNSIKLKLKSYCRGTVIFPVSLKKIQAYVLLERLVVCEMEKKSCGLNNAIRFTRLMRKEDGRKSLNSGASELLSRYPLSPLLLYVRAVTLAQGNYLEKAYGLVDHAFKLALENEPFPETEFLEQLDGIWKAVDRIGFRAMIWPASQFRMQEWTDSKHGADPGIKTDERLRRLFIGAQGLLENRRLDTYLKICKKAFENADKLSTKIWIIKKMLAAPLRRLPDYHASYALARESYMTIRPELMSCLQKKNSNDDFYRQPQGKAIFSDLLAAVSLARKLRNSDETLYADEVLRIAGLPGCEKLRFKAAAELARVSQKKYHKEADRLIQEKKNGSPTSGEVKAYFKWALYRGRYQDGHVFFQTLPDKKKYCLSVLPYIEICEKDCRFEFARQVAFSVAARIVCSPHLFRPFEYWKLSHDRVGELDFFHETALWFKMVPQPRNPKGVVFVAASDFKKLRSLPFVVLMEIKRQGWAVVPLVEGLLSFEPTGDPEIDKYAFCISAQGRVVENSQRNFPVIPDLEGDLAQGTLSWDRLDFSHALWEEAAILRRRYSVDFSCPDLLNRLAVFSKWIKSYLRILNAIKLSFAQKKIPAVFLTQSINRLPGAVFRSYCHEFGDPDRFCCVAVSTGYENYFKNFCSETATSCLLRNITAFPWMRTTGLLSPEEFEAWYAKDRHKAGEILSRVEHFTKINRVTGKQKHLSLEAQESVRRIAAWREKGGKVACLFGKVVCDLSVPYEGGPAHRNMKDWLNHTIEAVRDSRTLLLIKPHPNELKNEVGQFLSEYFQDLLDTALPDNVLVLDHHWFTAYDLKDMIDMGIVYNGTVAVELGLLGMPSLLCSYFAPTDYPVGHGVPCDRKHYERLVRFEENLETDEELRYKSAAWLYYLGSEKIALPYRYHVRQITNRVIYPPWWYRQDIMSYLQKGDPFVSELALKVVNKDRGLKQSIAKPSP